MKLELVPIPVTDVDRAKAFYDVAAVREELMSRGVETGEVDVQAWGKFIYFADPDGNSWAIQELPPRD